MNQKLTALFLAYPPINLPKRQVGVGNPYRQWIGAQMKAEIWGLIAPASPKVAAKYAEQDAMVTHVRNGIYGAQYIAAAVSIAMTENDPRAIVQKALRVLPENSEYARCIKDVLACYDDGTH